MKRLFSSKAGVICGITPGLSTGSKLGTFLPRFLVENTNRSIEGELQAAGVFGARKRIASLFDLSVAPITTFVNLGKSTDHTSAEDMDIVRHCFGSATREWLDRSSCAAAPKPDADDGGAVAVHCPEEFAQAAGEAVTMVAHRYSHKPPTSAQFRPRYQRDDDREHERADHQPSASCSPRQPPVFEFIGETQDGSCAWKRGVTIGSCQNLARDWAERPANDLTPAQFAKEAREILEPLPGIDFCEHDAEWLRNRDMNLLLAVGQGSHGPDRAPRLLEISYTPAAAQRTTVTFVGKGVMFDTGGVSLKPSKAMAEMRGDMTGAAACVALMRAVALLELPVSVRCLAPLVVNCLGSRSYKPGDVIRSASGMTVEIDNTDAEGRLALADAMWYAQESEASAAGPIISLATLTGNIGQALGEHFAGLFSNDDALAKQLLAAGRQSGDRLWRMPLDPAYNDELKSPIADLVNCSPRKSGGGAITAAMFLHQFVRQDATTKFAHIDIGGQLLAEANKGYISKGMRGGPVRGLVQFCSNF